MMTGGGACGCGCGLARETLLKRGRWSGEARREVGRQWWTLFLLKKIVLLIYCKRRWRAKKKNNARIRAATCRVNVLP